MAVEYPIHLHHAGSLAQVDVGANGIAGTPLVDDDEAQGLNIDEIGMVEVLVDERDGLSSKGLGSRRWTTVSADEALRAPATS